MNDSASEGSPARRRTDAATAGCVLLCGVGLALLLYVGSFVLIVADGWYGWSLLDRVVDERGWEALEYFYWPLIWLCQRFGFPG